MTRAKAATQPRTWGNAPLGPLAIMFLLLAVCSSSHDYLVAANLPLVDPASDQTRIVPGPWVKIPPVAGGITPPDVLVVEALKELLTLPGATHCEEGRPSALSAEYCVDIYRTPTDWRVAWPVRNLQNEQGACTPAFGGVDDVNYGRTTYVVGFAHNHPCDWPPSTDDFSVFPMALIQGAWEAVQFATDIEGKAILLDGRPIPIASWLITPKGRIFRWNASLEVDEWANDAQQWHHVARCILPEQSTLGYQPPRCTPELR